jgi:hypothetical protein
MAEEEPGLSVGSIIGIVVAIILFKSLAILGAMLLM